MIEIDVEYVMDNLCFKVSASKVESDVKCELMQDAATDLSQCVLYEMTLLTSRVGKVGKARDQIKPI